MTCNRFKQTNKRILILFQSIGIKKKILSLVLSIWSRQKKVRFKKKSVNQKSGEKAIAAKTCDWKKNGAFESPSNLNGLVRKSTHSDRQANPLIPILVPLFTPSTQRIPDALFEEQQSLQTSVGRSVSRQPHPQLPLGQWLLRFHLHYLWWRPQKLYCVHTIKEKGGGGDWETISGTNEK